MATRRIVEAERCSIVETGATCVVNPSNSTATLGGGVSRALFDECGGEALQQAMLEKLAELGGPLEMDDCLVTSGGPSTRVRYVLHVASVDYGGIKARAGVDGRVESAVTSRERIARAMAAAFRAAGRLADELDTRELSIAIPLLGAGSGGLSAAQSARAIIQGMKDYFHEEPEAGIQKIIFAVPEPDHCTACQREIDQMLVVR